MTQSWRVKACVFDAYGTLFDVHAPIAAVASELGSDAIAISAEWRTKQLEYSWLRSLMGRYEDFAQVTADALDYVLASRGIANEPLRDRLLALYKSAAAYPDAAPCLKALKDSGVRTGILSNGAPAMLSAAVSSAGIGELLNYVLSVNTVQIYKPSPQVYQLAVNAFGVEANEIAFVSANGWDCAGASAFGFRVINVNRFDQARERLGVEAYPQTANLQEAAALVQKMLA